jgi:hypothetical protein
MAFDMLLEVRNYRNLQKLTETYRNLQKHAEAYFKLLMLTVHIQRSLTKCQ